MLTVIVGIANTAYKNGTEKEATLERTPNVAAPQPTRVIGPRNSHKQQGCKCNTYNKLASGHDSAKNDLKIRRCIGCYCVEHRQCKKEAYQWSGVYNAVIIQLIYQLAILLKCTLHLSAQEQSCKTGNYEAADNGKIKPDL